MAVATSSLELVAVVLWKVVGRVSFAASSLIDSSFADTSLSAVCVSSSEALRRSTRSTPRRSMAMSWSMISAELMPLTRPTLEANWPMGEREAPGLGVGASLVRVIGCGEGVP